MSSAGIEAVAGAVVGFVIEVVGVKGAVYISGDTVNHRALDEIGQRFAIDTAFLHFGGAQFAMAGNVRFSMTGRDGALLAASLRAGRVVPIHFDGWNHFAEPAEQITPAFAAAGLAGALCWLTPAQATALPGRS